MGQVLAPPRSLAAELARLRARVRRLECRHTRHTRREAAWLRKAKEEVFAEVVAYYLDRRPHDA